MTTTTVTRTCPRTLVEWAVYELDEAGNTVGDAYLYASRTAARRGRTELVNEFGVDFGVFRRVVNETRA